MTVLYIASGHADWLPKIAALDSVVPLVKRRHMAKYAAYSPLYLVDDLSSIDAVLRIGLPVIVRHKTTRVVTLTEAAILPAAVLRESARLPGGSTGEAIRFTNKYVMKAQLFRAGLRTAMFVPIVRHGMRLTDVGLPLPFVVKPTYGAGAVGVRRIDDRDAWESWSSGSADEMCLAEEWVHMRSELHSDAVVMDGRVVFCAVSQYLRPLLEARGSPLGSYLLPQEDQRVSAVGELHGDVIAALGLRSGVTHLEVFDTDDGLVIGEIACRPGGGGITSMIEAATGVDLVSAAFALQMGRAPDVDAHPADGVYAWLGMPARPGRIVYVSGTTELESISGVLAAVNHYRIGELVFGRMTSTFYATTLLLRVASLGQLTTVRERVEHVHRLQVT